MSEKEYVINYWNIPGRAESLRVLLALGGKQFKNNFIPLPFPLGNPDGLSPVPFDENVWTELKPKTPWGSVPTLLLPSGKTIGQQRSLLRYLGKEIAYRGVSLYPSDIEAALSVDCYMDMLEDIWPILVGIMGLGDSMETSPLTSTLLGMGFQEDLLKSRMQSGSGDLALKFDCLENAISNEGPFLLGEDLSCADILLFAAIAWWGAGVFPGMQMMLDDRPKIDRAIRTVGGIEVIRRYYESLKASRQNMPTVGSTKYADYYGNFHRLCGIH